MVKCNTSICLVMDKNIICPLTLIFHLLSDILSAHHAVHWRQGNRLNKGQGCLQITRVPSWVIWLYVSVVTYRGFHWFLMVVPIRQVTHLSKFGLKLKLNFCLFTHLKKNPLSKVHQSMTNNKLNWKYITVL